MLETVDAPMCLKINEFLHNAVILEILIVVLPLLLLSDKFERKGSLSKMVSGLLGQV